jgi:hypothetical protein
MLNLVKDIVNPKNWLKLLKDPKKIKNFINRLNYYPGLKFAYSKSRFYRYLEIFFLIKLAKKNKAFQNFFFNTNNEKFENFRFLFDPINNINKNQEKCLSHCGIIILENILEAQDYKHIKDLIDNISDENDNLDKNVVGNAHVKKILKNIKIDEKHLLISISNKITQAVYGAPVKPSISVLTSIPKKIPEPDVPGDNIYHVDRYLPNIKMFYYPDDIKLGEGHFDFALGSHKIDYQYLKFFNNNEQWIFDERNPNSKKFMKFKNNITVKKNSLIVACTNGFHRRSKFTIFKKRNVLTFLYPAFNFSSLINFKKYNNYF